MNKRILRIHQVIEITGQSRSNIYLLMTKNLFPKAIKISERSVGWLQSDINNWIDSKIKNGDRHVH